MTGALPGVPRKWPWRTIGNRGRGCPAYVARNPGAAGGSAATARVQSGSAVRLIAPTAASQDSRRVTAAAPAAAPANRDRR